MKIGILTYHRALNIGASLQAHALNCWMRTNNFDCETIDYRCSYLEDNYQIKKPWQCKSVRDAIKSFMIYSDRKSAFRKFDVFNKKNQCLSKEVYTKDNISKNNYDALIVGSDQVWNMDLNGNDTTYLLDFTDNNAKRLSYAASFGGSNVKDEYKTELAENLKKFDEILVRENDGIDIVKSLSDKNAQAVLDPTLLLGAEHWDKICTERLHKKDYILLYLVAATPTALDFAKKLGKEYGCDVICIHYSYKKKKGVINLRDCAPDEFLSYVKYAKAVVASSFHALCFSIIYNKPFYYELDNKKTNNNSRLISLISNLNLESREIIDGKCIGGKIDYATVNDKLLRLRKQSEKLLFDALIN